MYDGVVTLFARMTNAPRKFAAAMLGSYLSTKCTLTERGNAVKEILLPQKATGHQLFAASVFHVVKDLAARTDNPSSATVHEDYKDPKRPHQA